MQAALDLFTTNGFQGTSIENITERAGESTGTFYLYFKNKVHIYRTLTQSGYDILSDMLREAVSWPGMNASARISAAIHAYYRFYREHHGYYKIINILHIDQPEFLADRENAEWLNQEATKLLEFLSSIIREGIENGEIARVDPWQATNVLWGMMDGIFLLEIRDNLDIPGVPLDSLIKQGLNMLLRGLINRDD